MSLGTYLFCLAPAGPLPDLAGLATAGENPPAALALDGFVAVVVEVPLADFCGPEAEERLADVAWVAPRALHHEEVVMTVMAQSAVLPVRFGVVFSSRNALAAALERHRETVAEFFRSTAGHQEWTAKGYVDRSRARAQLIAARFAAEAAALAGLAPGQRYLRERRLKTAVDREMTTWLRRRADEILQSVGKVSAAVSPCRLPALEPAGAGGEVFCHTALLVPDGAAEGLPQLTTAWNAEHADEGLQLACSGPWPPYHFTPALATEE